MPPVVNREPYPRCMSEPTDPLDLGVIAAAAAIRGGTLTATALTEAALARIAATDGDLLAWATVDAEGALVRARWLDTDLAGGRPAGPLHGVPLGVKDVIDVAGLVTTNGAPAFAHDRPTRDATAVARLRAAGAVIVGKTVATQFAYKDPAPTRNPWSAARTPGGSSSGSAAAVAARQVPAAIGTQTVGSILRPAAFCGVVGLKGTHGAISLEGVLPLAPTLDHVGSIARSVADAALLEAVMTGGAADVATIERPRLGVAPELVALAEPAMRAHLDELVARLARAGADVVPLALPPSLAPLADAGRVILEAEAAASHGARFAAHADEYGPQIAALVEAGRALDPAAVDRANVVRSAFRDAVTPILGGVDALLSPVTTGPAPLRAAGTGDFALCAPWSTAGVPSISIPTGLDPSGLPLALQLTGAPAHLGRLIGAAAWCEAIVAFDTRPPEVVPA